MDGTNGVNKHKYALTTLMVITKSGFGIPVAWIIHSSNSAETIGKALGAVAAEMGDQFTPSVVLIDDAAAEISAVQQSEWCASAHVQRGWWQRGAAAHAATVEAPCA